MPPFADQPWAKLTRDGDRNVIAALPLIDHCLDVAAVFEALLRGDAWTWLLTHTAGRKLTEHDIIRLIVLAALHDIGKANAGFHARWDSRAQKVGHEGEVAALLLDPQLMRTEATQGLHQIMREWGAAAYLPAVMAHHGRPREEFGPSPASGGSNSSWEKHAQYWRRANGYDPGAAAARVIAQLRERWPLAWEPGEKLPQEKPRFVALFAGLLVLADWIGSDAKRFPVEAPHGDLRDAMRTHEAEQAVITRGLASLDTPAVEFAATFGFPPRGVQEEAAAADLGSIALIEAETGSGKTEAALWRWLELRRRGAVDGLFFALPTRSAAVQLHTRVGEVLKHVWGSDGPTAVLAVPGYLRAGDVDGRRLPGWEVRWDDQSSAGGGDSRWAAEHSNHYLAARVAVGTIDQALLGALRVRHAPVRAAALARSLLVVDEVHASDAYMGGLLERLLKNHVEAGGQALLLSATLGAAARARYLKHGKSTLAEAVAQPYPALSGSGAPPRGIAAKATTGKRVSIEIAGLMRDPDAIAALAVEAARDGASVLVVRNSVAGAVAVAQAVEALAPDLAFRVDGVATLHHGRFAPGDRRLLDAAVEAEFGKQRSTMGRILVGTQTLEQSLDIDADLLLTDLAPMDVLLQRIGRLHRHPERDRGAFAEARAIVLCPAERDLTPLLGRVGERHGLGSASHGRGPYPNLLQLEATLRLLEANPVVTIPADNRRLVENALHPDILNAIARELGTAWLNHAAICAGIEYGDRGTANDLSLDLSTKFRDLTFPANGDVVATRLGASDLLINVDPPLEGPFGQPVGRLTIPSWMAGDVTADDEISSLIRDEHGWRFQLATRRFVYGRRGLAVAA